MMLSPAVRPAGSTDVFPGCRGRLPSRGQNLDASAPAVRISRALSHVHETSTATKNSQQPSKAWLFPPSYGGIVAAACHHRRWPQGGHAALWSDLHRLGMPVMLIRGGDGALVTRDDLDEMTRLLPAMRVEVVPGAGHAVQSDQPAALAVLISDFLPRELTIRGDRGQLVFW